MKASSFKYGILSFTLSLLTLIMALLPFHAFLTIWLSTFVGHYTALRLWKEVLTLIGIGFLDNLGYRQYNMFVRIIATFDWLARTKAWGNIARRGYTTEAAAEAVPVPAVTA